MEAAFCCGRERLVKRVKKFTAKQRPETTLSARTLVAPKGWRKVGASGIVQLEPAGSAKRRLEMARQTWTSAAGSANMEVSFAGKANREPELSCKTCLKRTLKRAPTFATPIN